MHVFQVALEHAETVLQTYKETNVSEKAWIRWCAGEVAGVKIWSDTHVRSYGGGGSVGKYGGYIEAPKIASTVVTNLQFFVKGRDGKETPVELQNVDISIRDGHQVICVWGSQTGEERGPFMRIENLTTGQKYRNDPKPAPDYTGLSETGWFLRWLCLGVVLFFSSQFMGSLFLMGVAIFGTPIGWVLTARGCDAKAKAKGAIALIPYMERVDATVETARKSLQDAPPAVAEVVPEPTAPPTPTAAANRFCGGCGVKSDLADKFCRSCGQPLPA